MMDEIGCLSKISDQESSDNSGLSEFSQTQESISKQSGFYVSLFPLQEESFILAFI